MEFTSSAGRSFPVEVRRRKGARHMRLRLSVKNRIVVSLPWHGSDRSCLKFIDQNRRWLERQIETAPELTGIRRWLSHSPRLSARGRSFAVSIEQTPRGRAHYRVEEEAARIDLHLPLEAGDESLHRLVRQFAKEALSARAAEQAARLGLDLARLTVRDQSSRWGSCSSKRAISLNWRLVLIPAELQDYVILHELAHLTEMNHSRRFWDLLERYDPERRRHEAELDALSPRIMRVGAVGLEK